MPIRVPRTTLPQEPAITLAGGGLVAPAAAIGNPAAAPARTATAASQLAAQIYQEERDREIQTRVLELDIARRRADGDVIGGYLQNLGKDAVERRGEVMAAIAANSRDVRTGIRDRAVADAWARQDAALTAAAQNQVDDHFRRQNIKWQADTQEARVDLLVGTVGRVAFGDGYVAQAGRLSDEAERTRSAYLSSIQELGAVLGWAPEQVEKAQRTADTQALGQVAESLLREERFGEAAQVLSRYGDRIDVGVRDRLAEGARQGQAHLQERAQRNIVRDNAARLALQLVQEAQAPPTQPPLAPQAQDPVQYAAAWLDDQLAAGNIGAELRDLTLDYVQRQAKLRDDQQAAASRQVVTEAERFLTENPMSVLQDNPRLYEAAVARGQLKGLLEFQRTGRYATDPSQVVWFRALSDQQLQQWSADKLWAHLRPNMSNQDLDDAMARHARAIGAANAEQLQVISVNDRIEFAARSLGLLPLDRRVAATPEQQQAFERWRLQTQSDLEAWSKFSGRRAGPEDLQRLLNLQMTDMVQTTNQGLLWDSTSRIPFALLPKRTMAEVVVGGESIKLSQLSERQWALIAYYLQHIGKQPTAQEIVNRWVSIGRPADPEKSGAGAAPDVSAPVIPAAPRRRVNEGTWRGVR